MCGYFERKLVNSYIDKKYANYDWSFYVIKDDIMTITCRDNDYNINEICVTLDDLINSYK